MITKKYYKLIRVSYADSDVFRVTNVSEQSGTLTVISNYSSYTFEYSTDGVTWTSVSDWTNPLTVSVPVGGNVYMKGDSTSNYTSLSEYPLHIDMNVHFNIYGNLLSLIDKTNYSTITTTNRIFKGTFKNDTNLIDASGSNFGNLQSSTAQGGNGFTNMFEGCSNLLLPPDMSNLQNISLMNMYKNCTSLTAVPDLRELTTATLGFCFQGCTSLVTGADISNVSSMDVNYGIASMYNGCSNLTTAYAPNVSDWRGTSNWLNGVAATGTLYCPSQTVADLIPDNDTSGCPSGWTKQIIA